MLISLGYPAQEKDLYALLQEEWKKIMNEEIPESVGIVDWDGQEDIEIDANEEVLKAFKEKYNTYYGIVNK